MSRRIKSTRDAARDCGGCSVCCTAMHVRALNKPAGTPCEHQTLDGCGNYAHRPTVCRTWFCMWVRDNVGIFNDDQRPDQLGLFFTASQPDPVTGQQVINAHEVRPGAAGSPAGREAIQFLARFARIETVPFREPVTDLTVAGQTVN